MAASIFQLIILFKTFLVPDWLTANCEFVVSAQYSYNWIWTFHIHIGKMKSESIWKTFLTRLHHDNENHIDSLTPLLLIMNHCHLSRTKTIWRRLLSLFYTKECKQKPGKIKKDNDQGFWHGLEQHFEKRT
jgi:hypothetical protein